MTYLHAALKKVIVALVTVLAAAFLIPETAMAACGDENRIQCLPEYLKPSTPSYGPAIVSRPQRR